MICGAKREPDVQVLESALRAARIITQSLPLLKLAGRDHENALRFVVWPK